MTTETTTDRTKTQTTDRYERGLAKLHEIDGKAGEEVLAALSDISPDFARLLIEFGFGDVYSRPTLDLRTKEIAVVAALTAMGTAAPQLKVHLNAALNVGVTREEITETMILMGVYAGGVERLVCRQGRIRRAGFDGVRARR